MTTIAAIIHRGRLAVGSDGATNWSGQHTSLSTPKMVKWDDGTIVAVSGQRRAHMVISRLAGKHIEPLEIEHVWSVVKAALIGDGFSFSAPAEGGAAGCGCSFIIALGDELWECDGAGGRSRFGPGEPVGVGTGSPEAVGALAALISSTPSISAELAVAKAVGIGIRYDSASGGDPLVFSRPVNGGTISSKLGSKE